MTAAPAPRILAHPTEALHRDLETAVEGALWAYDPLRLSEACLTVRAAQGVVTLAGNVRGGAHKAMAGRLAGRVPGVSGIINNLVSDTDLEAEVAQALAQDPQLALLTDQVQLKSLLGRLYLGGRLVAADPATAAALRRRAEELARSIPGVAEVLNQLEAGPATVSRTEPAAAPAPTAPPLADHEQAAMQARLKVWRERAAARRG